MKKVDTLIRSYWKSRFYYKERAGSKQLHYDLLTQDYFKTEILLFFRATSQYFVDGGVNNEERNAALLLESAHFKISLFWPLKIFLRNFR